MISENTGDAKITEQTSVTFNFIRRKQGRVYWKIYRSKNKGSDGIEKSREEFHSYSAF